MKNELLSVPQGEAMAAPPPGAGPAAPPAAFYGRPPWPSVPTIPAVPAAPTATTVIVDRQRGSSNFGDVAVGMAAGAVMGAALTNLGRGGYVGAGWAGVQDNDDVVINNYTINEYVGAPDWRDVSAGDLDYDDADLGADF